MSTSDNQLPRLPSGSRPYRDYEERFLLLQFGHNWRRDEEGKIDFMAMSAEDHNGPVCEDCGFAPCMHCVRGRVECSGPARPPQPTRKL